MNKNTMSSRGKIRVFLYTSAVIVVLGIFSIVQTVKLTKYERHISATDQMALISLDENLNNISTNLEKTIYSSTPTMLSKLASELWRETSGAKTCLSLLPTEDLALSNTYKFLSQVGEFVMALNRKSVEGEPLTSKEREQLRELYQYCISLSEQVTNMCYEMENGTFEFEEHTSTLMNNKENLSTINQSFDDVEQSLTDLPSLIYDGPFSEHLENSNPKFLADKEEISKENALKIAQKVCEQEKSLLEFAYEESGNIPCYVFQSENFTVAITKIGGVPLYMINSQFAGETTIKQDETVEIAKDFLYKIGYKDLEESYYFTDDGICTVNFASETNDIITYPDLIKVSVSLETGEVLSFDATGYVYNHTTRNLKSPIITQEEAEAKLNNELTVIDTQLCIIPTDWETEQYCYEIHCKTDNEQELLVYIDCTTGEEDNILILLYSDGGVLTK